MQFDGRHFKMIVENAKRMVMREFINNNVNAQWNSTVVSKKEVDDAIQDEDRIYINYSTPKKGLHDRVFIPTSVLYSSLKNRYRILGYDMNKDENGNNRVAFIVDKISDWQNLG